MINKHSHHHPHPISVSPHSGSQASPNNETKTYLNHDFSDEGCNKTVDDPGLGADPPGGDGAPPPLVDSWEDDDPLLTPDNDEDELEDQYSEAIIKPKKRPVKGTEETKSKKEHVNVVFIGHVGKFLFSLTLKFVLFII